MKTKTYIELTDKWIDTLLSQGMFNYEFLKKSQLDGCVIYLRSVNRRKVSYEIVKFDKSDCIEAAKRYKWQNDFEKNENMIFLFSKKNNLLDDLKNMYNEPLKRKPWYVW